MIQNCKDKYKKAKDHCLTWDAIKAEIRGTTISHVVYKSKERKELQKKLNLEMTEYESKLATNPNANIQQMYNTTKNELESINNHTTKGIMLRAQAKHIELNKANSKLFLGLERSKAKIKNISSLIVKDNIITDPIKSSKSNKIIMKTYMKTKWIIRVLKQRKLETIFLNKT